MTQPHPSGPEQDGPTDGQQAPLLTAVGLSKRFGHRTAVDQVDVVVRPGCIHGLLGPNGAGKTTVLRMLLGTLRPDAGKIELRGRRLDPETPRGRCGIAGFVDTPAFYPYLTASRNLELLSAWDGPVAHTRVEELLDQVGLADRSQSKVRGFSTGMRQRLGLAAALISRPQVLVVDEPTTGLDPAGIRDLHLLLADLAAAGQTIILSSHDLDEVELLCRDVTVLQSGQVAYAGTLADLRLRAPERRWLVHTADNTSAAEIGVDSGLDVRSNKTGQLEVRAETAEMDVYVMDLAAHGIAVREMRRDEVALEELFFRLTEAPA